ncbi:MAG: hypothetical protein EOM14_17125 [Clostridia bacterium]|nr:hypothetical protein [Clostridia bacterium]
MSLENMEISLFARNDNNTVHIAHVRSGLLLYGNTCGPANAGPQACAVFGAVGQNFILACFNKQAVNIRLLRLAE